MYQLTSLFSRLSHHPSVYCPAEKALNAWRSPSIAYEKFQGVIRDMVRGVLFAMSTLALWTSHRCGLEDSQQTRETDVGTV